MRDRDIRVVLKEQLLERYKSNPDTMIVEELGLRHGAARIDIAVVSSVLHGYEIKSDRDRLIRLRSQARNYNAVLDRVTLVVGYKHAYNALQIIPEWWGVLLVEKRPSGSITLSVAREVRDNPSPNLHAIAGLLWRDEALKILKELGASKGVSSKSRNHIYQRLVEVSNQDSLRFKVRQQLKERLNWRFDAQ